MTERKALHEHWREHYRKRRYARHLSKTELDQRIRDVINNLLVITPEAKIGLQKINHESMAWMETFTHLTEEMALRHGPYPAGYSKDIFARDPLPDFISEIAAKAAAKVNLAAVNEGRILIKYGKRARIESLYSNGIVRLQPASYFNGDTHNGAVRDDEKTIKISLVLSKKEILEVVQNPYSVPLDAPEQRMDIELKHPSDYWLFCVSRSIQPRLFVDFEADACLIIKKPTEFSSRLAKTAKLFINDVAVRSGPANYIDPLRPKTAKVDIAMSKDFRYSYQKEYRYCWLPAKPQHQVKPIDIEIGSLADISDLVVL